jgi:hypothetical protein
MENQWLVKRIRLQGCAPVGLWKGSGGYGSNSPKGGEKAVEEGCGSL